MGHSDTERDTVIFTLFICVCAAALGVLIATQPLSISIFIIGVITVGLMAGMTPITLFITMMVLAPLRTLITTESAFQLPLDIGQIVVLALLAGWAATRIAQSRRIIHLLWSDFYIPLSIFIGVIALTGFSAASLGAWITEWLKWLLMLVLVVLIMDIGRQRRWEWLIFGLVLAGVANALVGIYIFFGGSGALHLLVLGRFFRAFGTFGQPNPFGGFMGLIAPIAIATTLGYSVILWRFWRSQSSLPANQVVALCFYGVSSVLITLGLLMSWSRGAWLGFGISMMVLLLTTPRRLWQGGLLVLVVGLFVLFAWSTGRLPASVSDRIVSATQEIFVLTDVRAVNITTENYAIVERLAHWQAALNMATEHPWLGVGMGNYEVVYGEFRLINWDEPLGHAHNYYLNVLAEAGIIGLISYLFMLALFVLLTWQIRRHPDEFSRIVAMGLLSTWVYLMAHSLTDNLYVNNMFLHLGVILGVLSVLHREATAQNIIKT